MDVPSGYQRLIAGGAGLPGRLARGTLVPASVLYAVVMRLRNRWYDRGGPRAVRVAVPVVSIGNITTGGTGKTPLVLDVCRRLSSAGLRPAVVSRGYKAGPDGQADELLLLRRRLPAVACLADPDRAAGARRAVRQCQADVIVLDDGFQHRRLARDLDIVVIDATCPFGHGHVLPRGLLREPLSGIRRASLIVLSRVDQADALGLKAVESALDRYAPGVPCIRSVHRPTGLVQLDGVESPAGPADLAAVYCFAAIGNPGAFRRTVASMGIRIVGARWFPDHHRYRLQDLAGLHEAARQCGAAALLTTEKDAVKLVALNTRGLLPILAVRVEIDFPLNDGKILDDALDRVVQARRGVHEPTPTIPTG